MCQRYRWAWRTGLVIRIGTLAFNDVVALGLAGEQLVEVLLAFVARDGEASHRVVFKLELVALVGALAVRALGIE